MVLVQSASLVLEGPLLERYEIAGLEESRSPEEGWRCVELAPGPARGRAFLADGRELALSFDLAPGERRVVEIR